jgi:large subunit ribosomal protein L4
MTTIDIREAKGATTGSVELPAEIFDVTANVPLMHQVVVAQLAAARQGTHKTKTRGEVRGGGKKPYRQKGTGRARQGSTRAPQFAGGGVVHGPVPRDYAQKTPKKMKAAALRGALSDRARSGKVHVLAGLVDGETPSTKQAVAALGGLPLGRNVLVVCERADALTWKSLRNVAQVHLIAPDQLNTYDVLVSDDVIFTADALGTFLAGAPKGKGAKAVATSTEAEQLEPATKAGKTKAAAADVSTDELVESVAEQTSKDLLVEPAVEETGGDLPVAGEAATEAATEAAQAEEETQ